MKGAHPKQLMAEKIKFPTCSKKESPSLEADTPFLSMSQIDRMSFGGCTLDQAKRAVSHGCFREQAKQGQTMGMRSG